MSLAMRWKGAEPVSVAVGPILYLLAGAVLAPSTIVVGWAQTYLILVWLLGAMLTILVAHELRNTGHPLTPAGVLALGGLLLFFLRPLSVHASGVTSAGALADTRQFVGVTVDAGTMAISQVILFFVFFGLAYFHHSGRLARQPAAVRDVGVPPDRQARRAGGILVAATAMALISSSLLISGSGGLAAHLEGVSFRSAFFGGRYFLTLGYVPLAVALCLFVITRRRAGAVKTWNGLAIAGAGVLLLTAFITGGRGPLILGAVLPLLILKQIGPRRLSTPRLAVIGLLLLGGAMVMSLALRENVYTGGESLAALATNPVQELISRLTSGAETRPFDSLILLSEASLGGNLEWQGGWTYLATVTWFVPGDLLASKVGGANSWFTMEYLPRFYYPFRIETSVSAIGEAFANFGWFGIPIVGIIVGLAAARLSPLREHASLRGAVLYVVLTPLFFSFMRGDSYQNVSLIILTAVLAAIMVRIVENASGPPSRGQSMRPQEAGDRVSSASDRTSGEDRPRRYAVAESAVPEGIGATAWFDLTTRYTEPQTSADR